MSWIFTSDDLPEEQKIWVQDINISYIKVGTGENVVMLLPGSICTWATDFEHQIKSLDKNKFTIISWDPPGCGKSRPPDRTFPLDYQKRDAVYASSLMKLLGYEKYSLIGTCDGGIVALIIASRHPESVDKLIVSSSCCFVKPEELEKYKNVEGLENWPAIIKKQFVAIHGEEYLKQINQAWLDSVCKMVELNYHKISKESLESIRCPTLLLQGAADKLITIDHSNYLKDHIPNSQQFIFEAGRHDVQQQFPKEFNALATRFLTGTL